MAMTFHTTGHATKGKSLTVLAELQVVKHNGRTYKLLSVQTHDGLPYLCLRLYNGNNHFIKQMLFENEVAEQFGFLPNTGLQRIGGGQHAKWCSYVNKGDICDCAGWRPANR